jgi:hypothetical protein
MLLSASIATFCIESVLAANINMREQVESSYSSRAR